MFKPLRRDDIKRKAGSPDYGRHGKYLESLRAVIPVSSLSSRQSFLMPSTFCFGAYLLCGLAFLGLRFGLR